MSLLIGVIGSAPGIGKSTLCNALVPSLQGKNFDHFREEHILDRAEFAALAEEFQNAGSVAMETILRCMREFAQSCEKYDVVLLDSLLPFTPSLLAWGYSEAQIDEFMGRLTEVLDGHSIVIVYLTGDPDRALQRASEREGPGWLDGYLAKMRDCGISDVSAHLRREGAITRRVLEDQSWQLIAVDADDKAPQDVAAEVQKQLPR